MTHSKTAAIRTAIAVITTLLLAGFMFHDHGVKWMAGAGARRHRRGRARIHGRKRQAQDRGHGGGNHGGVVSLQRDRRLARQAVCGPHTASDGGDPSKRGTLALAHPRLLMAACSTPEGRPSIQPSLHGPAVPAPSGSVTPPRARVWAKVGRGRMQKRVSPPGSKFTQSRRPTCTTPNAKSATSRCPNSNSRPVMCARRLPMFQPSPSSRPRS